MVLSLSPPAAQRGWEGCISLQEGTSGSEPNNGGGSPVHPREPPCSPKQPAKSKPRLSLLSYLLTDVSRARSSNLLFLFCGACRNTLGVTPPPLQVSQQKRLHLCQVWSGSPFPFSDRLRNGKKLSRNGGLLLKPCEAVGCLERDKHVEGCYPCFRGCLLRAQKR